MHTMPVDLGFLEKCDTWRLESRFFPSKVGGKPAWLDLKNIPREEDLRCQYCNEPCIFLCQVYAPYEESEAAFHRTIYVFICKKPECCKLNQNGNVRVYRSQLPRTNDYYPAEPPIEQKDWRTDISVKRWTRVCHICGISAPSHCSKCKEIHYCCRAHQLYDWKQGHKEVCGTDITTTPQFLFPEYELIIEEENNVKDDNEENDSEQECQIEFEKYKKLAELGNAGTFQNEDVQKELMEMANSKEDETFAKFSSRIELYADQVLRYDRGGDVLYISSVNKTNTIPKCSECNGERQFEFQIMPQLLNFLELGNALKSIDWGILAIFTCVKSCASKKQYCAEYVWKQDITEEKADTESLTDNT